MFIELAPQDVVAQYIHGVGRRAPASANPEGAAEEEGDEIENLVVIEGDFDLVEDNEKDQAD